VGFLLHTNQKFILTASIVFFIESGLKIVAACAEQYSDSKRKAINSFFDIKG
jgi:hypothetical protein